jgi:hypothetical protein
VTPTSRSKTVAYSGNAFINKSTQNRPAVKKSARNVLRPVQVANMALSAKPASDDHGYTSIQIYSNERDITTTKPYQGNLTSLIKSIAAPIQDIMKHGKKEYAIDNPREFGHMSIQIPKKQAVKDPNDVTRTTIKETLIHDGQQLNLVGGAKKMKVYDPNDITRTTIKETLIHDGQQLNLVGGAKKIKVYDPNDVTRTTIKETLIHDGQQLNLVGGARKNKVYDPNAVARTTLKETLLQDADPGNLKTIRLKGVTRQHGAKAIPTIRETLEDVDPHINLHPKVFKTVVKDPADVAKKTVKETTLNGDFVGNVDKLNVLNGGYEVAEFDMKATMKESYVDNDHLGGVKTGTGDGYQNASFDIKDTMKQNPDEYFGGAVNQQASNPMSYSDVYDNATSNGLKSSVLVDRKPTTTSVKVAAGVDALLTSEPKKFSLNSLETFRDTRIAKNVFTSLNNNVEFTKTKQAYDQVDRLDMEILEPFKKNQLTQPLDSVA